MEWRCEWCGKPHEENDPPCDECGHGSFEEAVVQVPETDDPDSMLVWVCEECGRNHPKNSPPCSRCGHMQLRKEVQEFDESELEGGSYLDVGKEYIAAGIALVAVVALVAAGVIPVPGLGGPDIDDVPGQAESADGFDLTAVESGIADGINERRAGADADELRTGGDLDAVAERYNKLRVGQRYGDYEAERLSESYGEVGYECAREPAVESGVIPVRNDRRPLDTYGNESDLASAVVADFAMRSGEGSGLFDAEREAVGVDVHVAPDGAVYVTATAC
ncbi:hypothetical protein [Halostella litorea]|uniref:hypothetical protein n=1 Tax=Halostella litorea TaxID=2528831 RepID=UPI0013867F2A|nr:hypothetical protein [Halostella litorea]